MLSIAAPAPISDREFRAFRDLIRRLAGIQLSDAKREMVASRLARRLRYYGFTRYEEYYDHLRLADGGGAELREMVNCLTTNKTSFFREPHHFDFLAREVFARPASRLSIWSAGCSTGEEAYSLAIAAREALGASARERIRILATDIDTHVLEVARAATYDAARLADVPERLRARHFDAMGPRAARRFQLRAETASLVEFRHINLASELWASSARFDAIFCRNVIIYLAPDVRQRLIERFARCLRPGGYLILGHSETLHAQQDLFESLGQTVFRLRERAAGPLAAGRPDRVPAPALPASAGTERPAPARAPRTPATGVPERRIIAGGLHAGARPELVRTLLGSCVAACLYDPVARAGGMNHFMLPDGSATDNPARYGVHAMEMLINALMRLGAERSRLQAKVFGAASVLELGPGAADVAGVNARFIREFLATEGIPIVAERLGGAAPLDVRMLVTTGQVYVRAVEPEHAAETASQDRRYRSELEEHAGAPTDITLF